ncbi:MAG: ABC transporter permease [Candidatus Promineifilaceae bacterium]|jgi:Cu-processing system permease protein
MSFFIFSELTFREAQRRRILSVALIMGLAFLLLFALGFHYVYLQMEKDQVISEQGQIITAFLLTAGLYAANLLIMVIAVLVSVTTISGEIDSHTIDALLTKPIRRWEVVLGKWLAFAALLAIYTLFLAGGLMLIVYARTGYIQDNIPAGLALMVLQAMIILSITIAGGTRLSTLANGVLAFTLYAIAFLGGWVEQIGALFRNEAAVNIGIITSLIMPTEILWKKAQSLFQPRLTSNPYTAGPFAIASQPSNLMILYGILYMLFFLAFAMWSFSKRDL